MFDGAYMWVSNNGGASMTKLQVNVPEEPETVGALGAALLGLQRVQKRNQSGAPAPEMARVA